MAGHFNHRFPKMNTDYSEVKSRKFKVATQSEPKRGTKIVSPAMRGRLTSVLSNSIIYPSKFSELYGDVLFVQVIIFIFGKDLHLPLDTTGANEKVCMRSLDTCSPACIEK